MLERDSYWARFMQRRVSRRRALQGAALGAAGTAAYLAVGCGDDGEPTQRPQTGGQVKRGGTYRLSFTGDPPTLDPFRNTSFLAQTVAAHIYSRLFKFNSGPDVDFAAFEPVPDVAEEYEIADEGLTVTIKLKSNVMVHPPISRQFTSEDVRFSYDRFLGVTTGTPSPNATVFTQNVDRVETPDNLTVVFKLKQPFAPLINLLASPQHLWLFPKEADGGFDPTQTMIGTGPWLFGEYNASRNFRVRRNPQWHGAGEEQLPYLDEVNYDIIPEYGTRLTQFQGGNLDALGINANDLINVQQQMPDARFEGNFRVLMSFLYMNGPSQAGVLAPDSPFRDPRVRRALSMAVDRDDMSSVVYNVEELQDAGFEAEIRWNACFMPAGMGRYWVDPKSSDMGDARRYYQFNLQEAKQMLQAAGFDLNQEYPLRVVRNFYGSDLDESADLMLSYLRALGLRVEMVVEDYGTVYIPTTFRGAFSGMAYGYETPFTEPGDYLRRVFTPNPLNHSKVEDPRLIEMISRSDREFDFEQRTRLIHDVIRYASDQMYYVPANAGANQQWEAYRNYVRNAPEYLTSGYGPPTETLPYVWLDR